jgi:hypothetical protein
MDDAYVELKGVPEMKGSLNSIISSQKRLRRPPSLSESFAWEPENVLRATASNTSLDLMMAPATSPQTLTPQTSPQTLEKATKCLCNETKVLNYVLRFLFHITLISIFESVFFFLYISKLEDNGINNTVGTFVSNAVSVCENFTEPERTITNDVLSLFLNSSIIIQQGNDAFSTRTAINKVLFSRSWIYVGGLGGIFTLLTIVALLRKVHIKWKKLVLENICLVLMLAAYEYTFFSTVIFPYDPITGPEIARNAVYELQESCGILNDGHKN